MTSLSSFFPPTGQYIIYSKGAKAHAGRTLVEDGSLLPKSIITLPDQMPGQLFTFERINDMGQYFIQAPGHNYTSVVPDTAGPGGWLMAILLREPAPVEWTVVPQSQHGRDIYTITRTVPSGDESWVADVAGKTIAVRPLTYQNGSDGIPRFAESELWEITPMQVEA